MTTVLLVVNALAWGTLIGFILVLARAHRRTQAAFDQHADEAMTVAAPPSTTPLCDLVKAEFAAAGREVKL